MERVEVIWVSIRGLHQGQQLSSCANRPDTWMHPTNLQIDFSPCTGRVVHTWFFHRPQCATVPGGRAVHHITSEKLIATQWEDVLRLAASVRTGTVSASLMLKRLGSYPRQNGLALALREIGRIERTLFALDWLEKPQLRRQATAELNKGESRNALARAVCFRRLGRLHDRTAQAQQHRASGLTLVTDAIALWNTVYLGRALEAARRGGDVIPDALLAHLAPLGWQHINLTGDLLWSADATVDPDGFRPLRRGSPRLAVAVAA